jgi:hypothetical protein
MTRLIKFSDWEIEFLIQTLSAKYDAFEDSFNIKRDDLS